MRPILILPCLQILLCLGAGLVYACYRQWWLALYWAAAAVITFAVTFRP